MTTYTTSTEILATVKVLKAQARKIAKAKLHHAHPAGAHMQIALRRISDAQLFAERNTEHAEKCCWEARFHLNSIV